MKFIVGRNAEVSNDDTSNNEEKLNYYLEKLEKFSSEKIYENPENFLAYPHDESVLEDATSLMRNKTKSNFPKVVFLIGIGGANLATKAIYDAFSLNLNPDSNRKMVFLESNDSETMIEAENYIKKLDNLDEFIVIVVSKSGKTIEVLANAEFLLSRLEQKFNKIADRVIVVTENNSPLWVEAERRGMAGFPLSHQISDRFSAFSPTTTIPLLFLGFPAKDFLHVAGKTLSHYFRHNKDVIKSANILNSFYKKGFHIYDLFFFSPRLETLGKWHKQLIAESLAKDTEISGDLSRKGITPTVSIGSTDLHSMLQLYLAGPKERLTAFISYTEEDSEVIGDAESVSLLEKKVTNKTTQELNKIIIESVKESYEKEDLPFFEKKLEGDLLGSIAEYMVFSMLEVLLLGHLWNVDVFNQPNVEGYKERIKELLK